MPIRRDGGETAGVQAAVTNRSKAATTTTIRTAGRGRQSWTVRRAHITRRRIVSVVLISSAGYLTVTVAEARRRHAALPVVLRMELGVAAVLLVLVLVLVLVEVVWVLMR